VGIKSGMVSTVVRTPYTGLYNDAVIRELIDSHISRTSFIKWDTRVRCMSTQAVILPLCYNVDQPVCVTLNGFSLESEIRNRDQAVNFIALPHSPEAGEGINCHGRCSIVTKDL
jgi:hypothetical protein